MPQPRGYVFGPVASRRYGKSLGVDLVRMKTCTFSCVFCQLGPTPPEGHVAERTGDPPMPEILASLRSWMAAHDAPDFITAGGSGEPTLHRDFGDVFRYVRGETGCSSLLLSNGSLFDRPEVRAEAALADVVKVSLGAWDGESFGRLVRPAPGVAPFEKILEGYRAFRESFAGRLDCEVFLVPGINDSEDACRRIAGKIETFSPDTVSLNTAVRPGAEDWLRPVPKDRLDALRGIFGPRAAEAGAEPQGGSVPGAVEPTPQAVAELVSRHPVSVRALAAATGLSERDVLALAGEAGAVITATGGERFVAMRGRDGIRG